MKTILFFVLLALLHCCNGLVVTEFPHYQTFDSWPLCFQACTCYEQQCSDSDLRGGWTNQEFSFSTNSTTGFDEFNWWVKSDTTTSNTIRKTGQVLTCDKLVTGPCGGAPTSTTSSGTGKYLYAEASGCFGAHLRVRSPYVNFTKTSASISYDYYMFGADIEAYSSNPGVLNVTFWNGQALKQVALHKSEAPSVPNSAWQSYSAALTIPSPPATTYFIFEAVISGSFNSDEETVWKSDIAIDNVLITQEGASNETIPWIDPVTNNTAPVTPPPNGGLLNGGGGGLSDGAIAGIVVGIVAGLTCLCCLLLLLGILLLLLVSPRKPPQKGGGGSDNL